MPSAASAPVAVNEPRVVETFLTLCRFNTPSRQEKAASEWAGAYLQKLGFTVGVGRCRGEGRGNYREPDRLQKGDGRGRDADLFLVSP
jgi:hypothetical protein